jgi:TPR repeat protein
MKRLLTTLVVLTGLIGSGGAVWAQDYLKGVKAWLNSDYATALKEFRPLAEQGDADAQHYLGGHYRLGYGVTKDYAAAMKWYRKAAEQGHDWAQYYLALMYEEGDGVPQDYAEAMKWYRKAAEQGNAWAQNNLGVMNANGNGVLQDTIAAHMWFNIAAANGRQDAAKARDIAAGKLSSSDIVKAQQKAKRCRASGYKDCD